MSDGRRTSENAVYATLGTQGKKEGPKLLRAPAYFAELFGTRVRYSGASIGYQLASVFAGGLAFPISEYLIANYNYQAIAIYMALMALITVVSVLLASETYRGDIKETGPQDRELVTE